MRVWFDADNGPHVLIMRPLAEELRRRGHEVVFTARDRTRTCELLDLYGFSYHRVGAEYGRGTAGKVAGTLRRAWDLTRSVPGPRPAVAFGHGSRALPIAGRLRRVPNVTMYDYEWVNPTLFNHGCARILLPEAITPERCREAGIAVDRVVSYPGFKENLYLGGRPLDESVAADLGLRDDAVRVLLRPPATTAHYHNPEAELLLTEILARLAGRDDLQLILLPRTPDQEKLVRAAGLAEVIVPDRVYDGPSLVAAMDLVLSGGGTMTREAAILGVPSTSFFRGRSGMVDEELARQGRLKLLATAGDVDEKLRLEKRRDPIVQPDPAPLIAFVTDTILDAARA